MSNIAPIPQHASPTDMVVRSALKSSLYPGASDNSVDMVLAYCRAAGLDPMQKPVHIVPMWDSSAKGMRDVVMPGIGLYRTIAARSGCAGVSEPEFGPDVDAVIGGVRITYPQWCRVAVKRRLQTGEIVEFVGKELWLENYAVKGGADKSIAPNAMWTRRPYGQLAKCAEAQALRKAFPEVGAAPTAEEMEGKALDSDASPGSLYGSKRHDVRAALPSESPERTALIESLNAIADTGTDAFRVEWKLLAPHARTMVRDLTDAFKARCDAADKRNAESIDAEVVEAE